ncbi:MAG: hypothetical protein U9R79_21330 [Armatimonadota bacterium]|nr:hypothetical protein [Armatimonadota bacterium]
MEISDDLALRYLGDRLYGAILGQAGAARPANLVRSLPQGLRIGVPLIRQVLQEDGRFAEVAGRFDLAERDSLARRPFGGVVLELLAQYGRPMPIALMITGLASLRRGSPEYFQELLDEYEESRDAVAYIEEQVVDTDWLLVMEGDDEEAVLFYNDLRDDDELRELWQECEERDLRKRDPGLTAANILEAFDRPLGPRQLAFLTWLHHPQIFDPTEFIAQTLQRDDVIPAAGLWMSREQLDALHERLRELSDQLSAEGEEPVHVDIGEVLAKEPPATPYTLDDEDRANILSVVGEAQVPIGLDELIVDLLEISPDQRKFVAAAHRLQEMLQGEPGLLQVSLGRYLSRESIPDWVREVPQPLVPVRTEFEEDVLVEPEILPDELLEEVRDPVYEDVACGVEIEPDEDLMAEDSADCPLLHHHYVMGTVPVRGIDRPLFDFDVPMTLLILRDAERGLYPAWLNLDLGLMFGLSRWYQRYLPPSGAIFTIARTDDPVAYTLAYDGDTDEELTPAEERMAVLERKRERVSHRPISVFDLMVELLGEHEDGLSFNALWAEMNVVRRTSRWQIASLLAYYPCFEAADGKWSLDRELIREPGSEELEDFLIRDEAEEAEETEEGNEAPEE